MKSTILSIAFISLINTALSVPTPQPQAGAPGVSQFCTDSGPPSQDATVSAILSWNADVVMVNSFLNMAGSLSGSSLSDAATIANSFANDEPAELGILACIPNLGDDANNAIDSLSAVFGADVLDNLATIINSPDDTAAVTAAINGINSIRCCTVLPSVDILWPAAANALGVADQVQLVAPLESACSTIAC
jgi:hypothetical protein